MIKEIVPGWFVPTFPMNKDWGMWNVRGFHKHTKLVILA